MKGFINFFYTIPKPKTGGLRLVKAVVTFGADKPNENIIFGRNGFYLYTSTRHGELRCRIPTKRHYGRRLRRFIRNYVKSEGGRPSTVSFWISPFK